MQISINIQNREQFYKITRYLLWTSLFEKEELAKGLGISSERLEGLLEGVVIPDQSLANKLTQVFIKTTLCFNDTLMKKPVESILRACNE